MEKLRVFTVLRKEDESGVSGTGRVLDGVIFHSGQVVICWRGDVNEAEVKAQPGGKGYSSLAIYPSWQAFKHIHIDAHPRNRTEVVFGQNSGLDELVRTSKILDESMAAQERDSPDLKK